MKAARGWIALALVAIVVAAAAYLTQPHQASPEHSSNSDAANGTSAVRLFAESMGHPTAQIANTFDTPPPYGGLMFVFTPTSPYTSDEANRVLEWVRSGGVLVYASEQGDPELDRAFGVTRFGGDVYVTDEVGTPVMAGLSRAAGASFVDPLDPSAQQVAFLRSQQGMAIGYIQRLNSGAALVLADPLVLCNGYLGKADNGRLLANILALTGSDAQVAFDEYHHGLLLSDFAPKPWVLTPWGAGLLWLLVAVFVGLILRGRSFGPLIERPSEAPRSDAEWSIAVGELLRRSGARTSTLGLLATATERAVAARTGIPLQPRERFWNALWVRSPSVAGDLAHVEASLQTSAQTEQQLLIAARRLHDIAYPVPSTR